MAKALGSKQQRRRVLHHCLALLAAGSGLFLGSAEANVPQRSFQERLLEAHNKERFDVGVLPLQWDPALARDAQQWADKLARLGHMVHSPDDPSADAQGENLWMGTRGYYSPEDMVGLWVAERKNYREGIFPDNSRTGDLEDVGHYTQLIWASTRSVGCARATGWEDEFLVCRYSEGGNVIGERPV